MGGEALNGTLEIVGERNVYYGKSVVRNATQNEKIHPSFLCSLLCREEEEKVGEYIPLLFSVAHAKLSDDAEKVPIASSSSKSFFWPRST